MSPLAEDPISPLSSAPFPDPARAPRFCPRCRKRRSSEQSLCHECGEAIADQGYCGICESYWLLEIGAACPKHDVVLEIPPPPLEARVGVRDRSTIIWTTVRTFINPLEVQAPRIRLEAEGIPTYVEGERMASNAMGHGLLSGLKLQVPVTLLDDARVILAQSWSVPEDDLETAWEDLEPGPSTHGWGVVKIAVALFLIVPLVRLLVGWLFSF